MEDTAHVEHDGVGKQGAGSYPRRLFLVRETSFTITIRACLTAGIATDAFGYFSNKGLPSLLRGKGLELFDSYKVCLCGFSAFAFNDDVGIGSHGADALDASPAYFFDGLAKDF
jgi:hypothetical protein